MEEVPFHVYAMKEPDYMMSLMSMYGTNQHSGKETTCEWVDGKVETAKKTKFNYPEVVGNHFLYQHSVDDHNINDTHLLVWRLFGQQSIGQTESSASSSASLK